MRTMLKCFQLKKLLTLLIYICSRTNYDRFTFKQGCGAVVKMKLLLLFMSMSPASVQFLQSNIYNCLGVPRVY